MLRRTHRRKPATAAVSASASDRPVADNQASVSTPASSNNYEDICCICLEPVVANGRRYALLERCDHRYCEPCGRTLVEHHRQPNEEGERTLRSGIKCPTCRTPSERIIMSDILLAAGDQKTALFDSVLCFSDHQPYHQEEDHYSAFRENLITEESWHNMHHRHDNDADDNEAHSLPDNLSDDAPSSDSSEDSFQVITSESEHSMSSISLASRTSGDSSFSPPSFSPNSSISSISSIASLSPVSDINSDLSFHTDSDNENDSDLSLMHFSSDDSDLEMQRYDTSSPILPLESPFSNDSDESSLEHEFLMDRSSSPPSPISSDESTLAFFDCSSLF